MSKRALIVGINQFKRPDWQLRGCINDTVEMRGLLTTYFGFEDETIRMLQDQDATSQGIREGLDWLLSEYDGDGTDVRVFHFSSHGTQVNDQGDDQEWECKDEVIVPHDHDWFEPFRDDDLREIFETIPEGVNFTFVADCCHSGSIQRALFDAQVDYKPRFLVPPREISDRIRALQAQRDAEADEWAAEQLAEMMKDVPPDEWATRMKEYMAIVRRRFRENTYQVVPVGRHVLLAACEDRQTAADAFLDGEYRGAFTWSLAGAIKEAQGDLTYDQLIARSGEALNNFDQKPQLECPPDMKTLKIFAPLSAQT